MIEASAVRAAGIGTTARYGIFWCERVDQVDCEILTVPLPFDFKAAIAVAAGPVPGPRFRPFDALAWARRSGELSRCAALPVEVRRYPLHIQKHLQPSCALWRCRTP